MHMEDCRFVTMKRVKKNSPQSSRDLVTSSTMRRFTTFLTKRSIVNRLKKKKDKNDGMKISYVN